MYILLVADTSSTLTRICGLLLCVLILFGIHLSLSLFVCLSVCLSPRLSSTHLHHTLLPLIFFSLKGFGHGSVYKTAVIDLEEEEKRANKTGGKPRLKFCNVKSAPGDPGNESGLLEKFTDELDLDGLPFEGEVLEFGKSLCCMVDTTTGLHRVIKHKEHEKAFVETVRIIGSPRSVKGSDNLLRKVSITMRYPRSPVIGDKFSSRHGQKGTLSVLWPQVSSLFVPSIFPLFLSFPVFIIFLCPNILQLHFLLLRHLPLDNFSFSSSSSSPFPTPLFPFLSSSSSSFTPLPLLLLIFSSSPRHSRPHRRTCPSRSLV